MSLEINYIDAPEGAQEKMEASAIGGNSVADASSIRVGTPDTPWATLEPGSWRLDGSRKIMPDAPKVGWWSSTVSGNEGVFSDPPVITLSFPLPYSAAGITFTFSPSTEQWCSEIRVTWWSGITLIKTGTYYPTSGRFELEETVESFDKIEVELLKTNRPNEFAKVQKIEIGRTILLGAKDIIVTRLTNEVDPSACELSADMMSFEIRDVDGHGFLPQENQRVELYKDGALKAVHYITSSTRKSSSNYLIYAQSAIGLLNNNFLGGIYENKPVKELLTEILGSWEYEIHETLSKEIINGYIPACTQREALQQLAFAIGAIVTTQGSPKIRLIPVPSTVSSKFTADDIMLGASVESVPRIARVEVLAHTYTKSDTVETLMMEETVEIEDGEESALITFASPHYDYQITGGEIAESGVNYVRIKSNGPITLSGKTYLHTTRTFSKRNPAATAKEQGNHERIQLATLVNPGNAPKVVERLYSARLQRQTVKFDAAVNKQTAGEMASAFTPWGTVTRGFIGSMNSTLTQNGFISTIELHGIESASESVWVYSGELHSGDMGVLY